MEGKVAVVTGATGALGRVVAKELLVAGARVVSTYRSEASQKELADFLGPLQAGLTPLRADVTVEGEVHGLFQAVDRKFGRVDALLNIVGAYLGGNEVQSTPAADWDAMMSVNLRSAFLCCREALPFMLRQNYGKIVNISARPALERRYRAKGVAYAVAKAGVLVLTETIAEETKKFDINANAVLPSTIDTPDNRRNMPQADHSKWVSPEDIAKVIMLLLSDESRVTSGAAIPVYGKA